VVDPGRIDETGDPDFTRFGRLQGFEFLLAQHDDLSGVCFITALNRLRRHRLTALGMHHFLLHGRLIRLVQQAEMDRAVLYGGIELDRDAHSAEPDHAFPHRPDRHAPAPPLGTQRLKRLDFEP
jgi:hypothetical protein